MSENNALTEQEVNYILFEVNLLNVSEMVKEIYQRGYDQAVKGIEYIDESGVILI